MKLSSIFQNTLFSRGRGKPLNTWLMHQQLKGKVQHCPPLNHCIGVELALLGVVLSFLWM